MAEADAIRVEIEGADLIPAIDRTTRTIIMALDAAVKRLESLGYERDLDIKILDEESSFPGVVLRDRYVFGIVTKVTEGRLVISGEWLTPVRPLPWFRRKWREWTRARAS